MTDDDVIADLRARFARMPVYIGTETTVPMLPAPESVAEGTYVYASFWFFMQAVGSPYWSLDQFAEAAPPLEEAIEES